MSERLREGTGGGDNGQTEAYTLSYRRVLDDRRSVSDLAVVLVDHVLLGQVVFSWRSAERRFTMGTHLDITSYGDVMKSAGGSCHYPHASVALGTPASRFFAGQTGMT